MTVKSEQTLSAGQAFQLSRLAGIFPEIPLRPPLAADGRLLAWDEFVPAATRLDVLRPLLGDPMEIRRRRAGRQRKSSNCSSGASLKNLG